MSASGSYPDPGAARPRGDRCDIGNPVARVRFPIFFVQSGVPGARYRILCMELLHGPTVFVIYTLLRGEWYTLKLDMLFW